MVSEELESSSPSRQLVAGMDDCVRGTQAVSPPRTFVFRARAVARGRAHVFIHGHGHMQVGHRGILRAHPYAVRALCVDARGSDRQPSAAPGKRARVGTVQGQEHGARRASSTVMVQ